MSLYTDVTKEIIESILSGVKDGIEELSNGDKTFKARIVELTSPAKCKVLYNGVNYTVISNVYCEVGDLVRVCAPCNNWNELYVEANLTPGKTLRDIAKLETRVNELKNTITELNTKLCKRPNYNSITTTRLSDDEFTYTATKDVYLFFDGIPVSGANIQLVINNKILFYGGYVYTSTGGENGRTYGSFHIYLNKGDTVTIRNISTDINPSHVHIVDTF